MQTETILIELSFPETVIKEIRHFVKYGPEEVTVKNNVYFHFLKTESTFCSSALETRQTTVHK